jgi:hypothetical protein
LCSRPAAPTWWRPATAARRRRRWCGWATRCARPRGLITPQRRIARRGGWRRRGSCRAVDASLRSRPGCVACLRRCPGHHCRHCPANAAPPLS